MATLAESKCQSTTDNNTEICRLCEMGDLKSAMHLLYNLDSRNSQLELKTFCSILQLCADLKSLPDGAKVHEILSASSIQIDGLLGLKLVFMYIKCGDLGNGRKVFDVIQKENVFLWNLVMNEYARIKEYNECISLFGQMLESGIQANSHAFSCILKCVAALGSTKDGKQIHGLVLKLRFDSYNAVGNALVACYSKCKNIELAQQVFDKMVERDVISWNSMINGYVSSSLPEKGVQLLREMWLSGVYMDLATLVSALPACAQMGFLQHGRVLHGYAIKSVYREEITLHNSLLSMYTKCQDLDSGVKVFSKMKKKSVVTWTSMISGYVQGGQFNKALRLFEVMEEEGVMPDLFAITSVLHACACNGSLEHGKRIHDHIIENGLESHLFVANSLIAMYAKCGSMVDAESVFNMMVERDIVSWNTMIGGYSKNSLPNEALSLFSQMQGLKPNSVTVASVLPACASLSTLEKGREIHGHILRNGFFSHCYVANALVDMYAKCGALVLARLLFDHIQTKDLVSWTVMIAGYGMHGHGRDAILLFSEMRKMGIEPDEVSFIAILYACSHSGLIDEGRRIFHIMRYDCKIEPKLEHYACMVDLLARAGRLTKAYQFIESMPIQPDSTVWGALLCGCRTHRDVKLAEKVAEHVFELEPENTGYYVLLANIYAESEKWEAVKKLRERIGRQRLRKKPGCSWIEIKDKVHVFVSGDRLHQQAKNIWSFLERVNARMKQEGYISNKRYALIDVDDAGKEEVLCGHSERLAIAFGILNLPSRKPIRVSKNLRVCGDCHEVAKFISKMVGREIILRDSNRFHQFVNGRCSCRGFW
ncbi:pentatricopeptide repeat-containing protein DOT4, chloroplastic [Aristolochia californica]|uniref:pentatricopeptide repeat-containing protein DOT4, chloroplastic n=1 Tax=Aristolochia californica TaxID=171875 RepID=UPI0035DF7A2E